MTPRDPSDNLTRVLATWLPRLADQTSEIEAARAIRGTMADARRSAPADPRGKPATREEHDARELEPYAAALPLLSDHLRTLIPAWIERFLVDERAAYRNRASTAPERYVVLQGPPPTDSRLDVELAGRVDSVLRERAPALAEPVAAGGWDAA